MYRGQIYYTCTNRDYGGRYWCANNCQFKYHIYYRGLCKDDNAPVDILGAGVNLGALNVFIGLLLAAGFVLSIILFCAELRNRRNSRRVEAETTVPGFGEQRNAGPQGGVVGMA